LKRYDEASNPGKNSRPFILEEQDQLLVREGTSVSTDDRFGVPTFVWAAPRSADAVLATAGRAAAGRTAAGPAATPEQAARTHLKEYGRLYRLTDDDVQSAVLGAVHDTGGGGIIVSMHQKVGGLEVFRNEIRILMNRDLEL